MLTKLEVIEYKNGWIEYKTPDKTRVINCSATAFPDVSGKANEKLTSIVTSELFHLWRTSEAMQTMRKTFGEI